MATAAVIEFSVVSSVSRVERVQSRWGSHIELETTAESCRGERGMIVRFASDDIEEVRRALSSAYGQVIRELGQFSGLRVRGPAGVRLCRRKWKLEALLRQFDGPEKPPATLEMVPRRDHTALEQVAA